MKLKYSLRSFLVGSVVIGLVVIFVLKVVFRIEPEKINSVLLGQTTSDPAIIASAPTLFEIVQAVSTDYKKKGIRPPGQIQNPKIEVLSTSIGPEKFMPLLGNSRMHTTIFRCSVEMLNADGSSSDKIFLIERQNFEILSSQAGTMENAPQR